MERAVSRLESIGRVNSAHYRRLAMVALESGHDDAALTELEKSLTVRDHPRAHFDKGRIFAARGDWDAAADAYERAYAIDPYPVKLIHRLAVALLAAGRTERAREVLVDGLVKHPGNRMLTQQFHVADRAAADAAEP